MKLSKAIEGYFIEKRSAGYSPKTIILYGALYKQLLNFLGDVEVEKITSTDLKRFMIHMQEDHVPVRFPGARQRPISRAHLDNHWKSIRSLFKFLNEALGIKRPDNDLKRPEKPESDVRPLSIEEFQALLTHCDTVYTVNIKGEDLKRRRPQGQRNRALLMLMLDTGLRVGEICRIQVGDVNLESGEVHITPYGAGKKSRPRTVFLGKNARREMWLYMSKMEEIHDDELLFDIDPHTVQSFLLKLGRRAGVPNVHPHRLRHTFAIQYLRNGGDVFTLKRLLGHSDLAMVERYLEIAKTDISMAHRDASPADRWKLKK